MGLFCPHIPGPREISGTALFVLNWRGILRLFEIKTRKISLLARLGGGEGGIRALSTTLVIYRQASWILKRAICDRQPFAEQFCKDGPLLGYQRKDAK